MAPDLGKWFPSLALLKDNETARLMAVGVGVGAVGGLAAGAFDQVVVWIHLLVMDTPDPAAQAPDFAHALLAPAFLGLLAGLAILYGARSTRALDPSDVIEAARVKDGRMSLRHGIFSALGAALMVGGGHSLGREGPIAQLAGALSGRLCHELGIPLRRARILVAAGAAAGIAASFDTPLGGIFFAMEILLGNFALQMFGPVVAATVTGTVVGQAVLGDRQALVLPTFTVAHPAELLFYLLLGALCGLVAVAFKRGLLLAPALIARIRVPWWIRPAVVGLGVGLLGAVGLNGIMGNGYATIEVILSDQPPAALMLLLLLVTKAIATIASSATRVGGGIFAPSLFLGAATGTLFGTALQALLPDAVPSPGAFGMVGMGAVVAAVTHAPITTTLMLFEMTGNYQIILALLLALTVAGVVANALDSQSIYLDLLRMRKVNVHRSHEELVMYEYRVSDLMRREGIETIRQQTPFPVLAQRFLNRGVKEVYVTGDQGELCGVIHLQDIKGMLAQAQDGLKVGDVRMRILPFVHPDQPIAEALPLFVRIDADELPVVDVDNRLVGRLTEHDVMCAYHREVMRKEALLARVQDKKTRHTEVFELPEGHVMDSVPITGQLAGHSLKELRLKQRYDVTVIAECIVDPDTGVERRRAPDPDVHLKEGDRIVVMGPAERVADLKDAAPDREDTQMVAREVLDDGRL